MTTTLRSLPRAIDRVTIGRDPGLTLAVTTAIARREGRTRRLLHHRNPVVRFWAWLTLW